MAYKIKLTEEQKEYIFKITDCSNKQKKLMSVWAYIIKHKESKKTINKLYNMYKLYHMKMSKSYFYELVEIINSFKVEEKVEEKVETPEIPQSVDNSVFKADDEKGKNEDLNLDYNTNTLYTSELVAPVELVCTAIKMLKELNIKSELVKEFVINKLRKCFNINRSGMINYIATVIASAKAKQEQIRIRYAITLRNSKKDLRIIDNINNAKNLKFNNFEGRKYTEQHYNDIESILANV